MSDKKRDSMFIGLIVATGFVFLAACWFLTCRREHLHSGHGDFYYWRHHYSRTFHGICASMYSNEAQTKWKVDHPYGYNPDTRGSTGTETRIFSNRYEAEHWAENRCPSWSNSWKEVE